MKFKLISVEASYGSNLKGTELAPGVIKSFGLLKKLANMGLLANDEITITLDKMPKTSFSKKERNFYAVAEICRKVYQSTRLLYKNGHYPLILGGDHSISCGSLLAAQEFFGEIAVIWLDAHCDYNSPSTTITGNIHGMPLASACGRYERLAKYITHSKNRLNPQNVILAGVRDIDSKESLQVKKDNIKVLEMIDVITQGFEYFKDKLINEVSKIKCPFYLSMDMDVVSPYYAPGVSVPKLDGFNFREILALLLEIKSNSKIIGFDLLEVNPLKDNNNITSLVASELIMNFFSINKKG